MLCLLLGLEQLDQRPVHVVHESRAHAVRGVAGVGRIPYQRQVMLKAGVTAIDGLVATVGARAGLSGNLLTAFGTGLEHGKAPFFRQNKRCAAEATHRKTYGSLLRHNCFLLRERGIRKQSIHFYLDKNVYLSLSKYSIVSQIHYSTSFGICK